MCYLKLLIVLFCGLLPMSSYAEESKAEAARKVVGDRVLIILAKQPHPDSHVLELQDYIREGKSFVPFFSSKEAFNQSTQGTQLDRPVYEIDRRLFVEIAPLQGILVLNPGLDTEMTFTGAELKTIFLEEFKAREISQ